MVTPATPSPRTWQRLGLALLISVAVVGGYVLASPPQAGRGGAAAGKVSPRVFALLHVAPTRPSLMREDSGAFNQQEFDLYRQTQVALLKSRVVLNAALRQPRVAGSKLVQEQADPLAWLETNLLLDSSDVPTIVRVGLPGKPSEDLALLVNAVVEAYQTEVVNKEHAERLKRLDMLRDYVARHEEALRSKQRRFRSLAEAFGMTSEKDVASPEDLVECKRELRRIRLAKAAVGVREARLKAAKNAGDEGRKLGEALAEEAAVLAEQERLLKEELEGSTLLSRKINANTLDMTSIEQGIRRDEAITERMNDEIDRLKTELNAGSRVTLLQPATAGK